MREGRANLGLVLLALLFAIGLGGCGVNQPSNQPATPTRSGAVASEPTATAIPTLAVTEPPEPTTAKPEVPAYEPVFESADCWTQVPASYATRCGYLIVPEDRSRPGGAQVRLPVAIFASRSPNPAPDPVFHLVGGPGGNLLDTANFYLKAGGDHFLVARDYILFNQRGTHYSTPSLECSGQSDFRRELAKQELTQEERDAQELEYLMTCRDALLEQGIVLEAYDSATIAADVDDLRAALGYEQVNLYGISYGTRLALTIMRDHPGGVRSVILDSVYPPQVALDSEVAASAHRAFTVLFEDCAADPLCSARYPDLETEFYQTADRLNEKPQTVQLQGDQPVYVDGDIFLDALFGTMYRTDAIPWVPLMIHEASRGNFEPMQYPLAAMLDREGISWGMHHTLQCREEVVFESYEGSLALAEDLPSQLADHFASTYAFDLCAAWQVAGADPVENEPIASDIPTLVLSGQYDPVTPPAWGRLAADTLSRSFFYEFPGVGHGVMRSNECGLGIGLEFLDDPTTEPDASCLGELAPPDFK